VEENEQKKIEEQKVENNELKKSEENKQN